MSSKGSDYLDNLATKAPLEYVAEFLSLDEMLSARLISARFAEAIDNLSSSTCARHLHERLISQSPTVHMVSSTCWQRTLDLANTEAFFQRSDGCSLKSMLRCFRVLQCLPMEVGIAFSGEYGRHCVPLRWNEDHQKVEAFTYSSCTRPTCPTCQLKIDVDTQVRPACAIYKYLNMFLPPKYDRRRVDLSRYHPKCIPNLPPDMVCPYCADSKQRSMVLSTLSYKSSTSLSLVHGKMLAYTPLNEGNDSEPDVDDGSLEEPTNEQSDDFDEEPTTKTKRQRGDHMSYHTFAYPHIFDEVAIPKADVPIRGSDRAKHAIAIHCVSCEMFGMLVPANPCSHEHFRCQMRAKNIQFGVESVLIGAIMVRSKCHNPRCNCSPRCMSDCREFRHSIYDDPDIKIPFKCWCPHCHPAGNGRYCDECAWLTTVCHHV